MPALQPAAGFDRQPGLASATFAGLQTHFDRLILGDRPSQDFIEQSLSIAVKRHDLLLRQEHQAVGHPDDVRVEPRAIRQGDQ
jgi:hypothetical protein